MQQREPLKDRALGRWHGILSAIGLPAKALANKHGPCPIPGCGGKDRFRYDDKGGRGTWICSQCGAGDGIELVKKFLACDFKAAAAEIEKHIGSSPVFRPGQKAPAQDDGKARAEMIDMWKRATPITRDDYAGQYLHKRGLGSLLPENVRFSPDERYAEAGSKPTWHPIMLAKVDPCDTAREEGQKSGLHRTFLDKFGGKADVASPRKMMGSMPTGAAVRLFPPAEQMGIAEGIETAIAASIIYGMPVWSALTEGLLAEWVPPAVAKLVFIFGDNDVSYAGQAAAFTLAKRLKVKGFDVFVELPPRIGTDWNDVLLAQAMKAAA